MTLPISSLKPCLLPACLAALGLAASGCVVERTVTENGEVVFKGPVDEASNRDIVTGELESPEAIVERTEDSP